MCAIAPPYADGRHNVGEMTTGICAFPDNCEAVRGFACGIITIITPN
jgi:hypothetical protein